MAEDGSGLHQSSTHNAADLSVNELRKQLAEKEEELRNAHTDLEGVLYAISHDLRAPLRAVMTCSMILREDFGPGLGAKGIAEIARLEGSARKINSLLEEVLVLSRITRYELEVREVDLSPIFRESASAVSGDLANALEIPDTIVVCADPVLMRKAIECLMDNAWKFRKPDRPLEVTVTAEGGRVSVADNGIGWNPESADRCFVPFGKINGNDYPGLGMGLAVVKRIVAKHRGTVGAGGALGEGATVWFELGDI